MKQLDTLKRRKGPNILRFFILFSFFVSCLSSVLSLFWRHSAVCHRFSSQSCHKFVNANVKAIRIRSRNTFLVLLSMMFFFPLPFLHIDVPWYVALVQFYRHVSGHHDSHTPLKKLQKLSTNKEMRTGQEGSSTKKMSRYHKTWHPLSFSLLPSLLFADLSKFKCHASRSRLFD